MLFLRTCLKSRYASEKTLSPCSSLCPAPNQNREIRESGETSMFRIEGLGPAPRSGRRAPKVPIKVQCLRLRSSRCSDITNKTTAPRFPKLGFDRVDLNENRIICIFGDNLKTFMPVCWEPLQNGAIKMRSTRFQRNPREISAKISAFVVPERPYVIAAYQISGKSAQMPRNRLEMEAFGLAKKMLLIQRNVHSLQSESYFQH